MLVKKLHILVLTLLSQLTIQLSVSANEAKVLYQTCAACHGAQGEGKPTLASPALAGQYDWYTHRQLENFKNNLRGFDEKDSHGQQMRAVVSQLDFDKDVSRLAKFIAEMPAAKMSETVSGDLMNGSRYYQAKCGACHGGKAEGNIAFKAPKLSNQDPSYLIRQMRNFVSGARGSHADDKLGRQMAMMAKTVNEKELNDIIFFISQQP